MAGLERGLVKLGLYSLSPGGVFSHLPAPVSAYHLSPLSAFYEELLAQLVNRGEIHLCLTFEYSHPEVTWVPLLTEEIFLAVPADHRFAKRGSIPLSEAAHEDFLLIKPVYAFRMLTEGFCRQAGFEPNVVFDGDESAAAIAEFVRAGLGISFSAGAWRKWQPNTIAKVHIEEPICQQTIGLAWHNAHYLSAAARVFRDFVIAYFATLSGV